MVQVPEPENVVADALSCSSSSNPTSYSTMPVFSTVPLNLSASGFDSSTFGFDSSTFPALQSACPSLQSMISNFSLSVVSVLFLRSSVLCDVSSGSLRPLVPSSLLNQLFLSLHCLSHPGVHASQKLLSSKFVWPGMPKDVGLWTRSCLCCQQSKIQSHVKSPIPSIPVPGRRFSHMHLDLVGPVPYCQGFCYLLKC